MKPKPSARSNLKADATTIPRAYLPRLAVFVLSGSILAVFYLIFVNFFPNTNGRLGHDYSYFFPQLLDGKFWFDTNGLLQIPWFTPSFGGGLPKFPNPQSMYYSVPQFLCFFMTPLASVRLTLLIFACLGYAGFYFLLRRVFLTLRSTAILGATLFLFNGFFAHRMIIGHLPFHAYMLLPAIAYFALHAFSHHSHRTSRALGDIALGGLILAYAVYSGATQILPPMLLGIVMCGIAHILRQDKTRATRWAWPFALVAIVAAGLLASAACINAFMSFLGHFPRTFYPLPGVASMPGLVQLSLLSLFGKAPVELANSMVVNKEWALDQHELEYGIGFVPLIILVSGMAVFMYTAFKTRKLNTTSHARLFCMLSLALLLLIPLALNFYSPSWNALLKTIPVIKESSSNFRWLCAYIPVAILLACLTFERVCPPKFGLGVVLASVVLILLMNGTQNREFYQRQEYNPDYIDNAYLRSAAKHSAHEIVSIGTGELFNFDNSKVNQRNDVMIAGYSQMEPYEPIFGYRLETFPIKTLRPGPVMQDSGGVLDLKNPAGYVFPRENNCSPGDHFTSIQKDDADKFRRYLTFPFAISARQRWANVISVVSISTLLGYLLFFFSLAIRQKRPKEANAISNEN